MPPPWSSLVTFATICVPITLISCTTPPDTPLWLVISLAILATVLIVNGPNAGPRRRC